MNPQQYCQQRALASGSSFYYSFLFLPPQQRAAITAFYAFCREVDDIVDECSDPSIAQQKLLWWQTQISALFSDATQETPHPVCLALKPHVSTFQIEQKYLQAIIKGVMMDLHQNTYPDFASLSHYCWHVASAVGIVAARIFGYQSEQTLQYAEKLGLALQLTNIIRDVGEDARKGRIYLPQDELKNFGLTSEDILQRRDGDEFKALMHFQAQRALQAYEEALNLLPDIDRRAQRPGLMMAAIYKNLLHEIARDRFQVLEQRISLTPLRKLWVAWKTYLTARV